MTDKPKCNTCDKSMVDKQGVHPCGQCKPYLPVNPCLKCHIPEGDICCCQQLLDYRIAIAALIAYTEWLIKYGPISGREEDGTISTVPWVQTSKLKSILKELQEEK